VVGPILKKLAVAAAVLAPAWASLALSYDYRNNVSAYPRWQEWLRTARPPMLVVWGRYDTSFQVAGVDGFAKDDPNAEVHVIDAGHFPLDESPDEVRALTMRFLRAHLRQANHAK